MRDIKFRAKRIDNGQWAYGFLYRHDPPLQCFSGEGKELPSFAIIKTGFADWNMPRPIEQHEVDGKTVGELTGLKDKNGKEIYEGDILDFEAREWGLPGFKSSVEWDDKEAAFCFGGGNPSDVPVYRKVIGNIYENPELIKQCAQEKS